MNEIINFFGSPFFNIWGGLTTILMLVGFLYTCFLVLKGVLPVWYRLGRGLSSGRIAIFSINEAVSLEEMIIGSKIFKKKNIIKVTSGANIEKAEGAHVLLVHWKDFEPYMSQILQIKKERMALIIYAPSNEGRIGDSELSQINSKINSVIVNCRGRLLNDILTSLVTISYEWR